MKNAKFYLLLVALCSTCFGVMSQAPQQFNYQAVVRDGSGNVISNRNVSMRFTIHTGSPTGGTAFRETDTVHVNSIGVITVVVGGGAIDTGSMSDVNWANGGGVYLQVELDPAGGNLFNDMGTTQMVSVPYALYAASAGNNKAGPTGPQGPVGTQGLQGVPGAQGATGPMGPTGATGSNGINGARGATGPQGSTGVTGAIGSTGPQGTPGNDGINGATGAMGPQGPVGAAGPVGATGPQGVAGAIGATGAQGAAGIDGAVGAAGPIGLQGPAGITGAVGTTGPQGPAGNDGMAGATGPQGPMGLQGMAGATGPQGLQGLQGVAGATGATGIMDSVWSRIGNDINMGTGNVGINQPSPQAALDVNGSVRLGANAPIMQMFVGGGQSPSYSGGSVSLAAWTMTDLSILHVSVFIHTTYHGIVEAVQGSSNQQYSYTIQNSVFTLTAPNGIGSDYLNMPYTVLVTYAQ